MKFEDSWNNCNSIKFLQFNETELSKIFGIQRNFKISNFFGIQRNFEISKFFAI